MKFNVMSFNLRYDKPDSGNKSWHRRREAVAELISHYKPEIISTQECLPNQLLDLHRLLPIYQSVGCDRDGTGKGEHCAIFYRTDSLSCLDNGDFWLSDTPQVPASKTLSWGNLAPRFVSWAKLYLNEKKILTVFNTHLDFESETARIFGAKLITDYIPSLVEEDSYILLTGDFNCTFDAEPRKTISRSSYGAVKLVDPMAMVDDYPQNTFHRGFTGEATVSVDTIYFDSRLRLVSVEVNKSKWQGVWPSDHFPVITCFETVYSGFHSAEVQ